MSSSHKCHFLAPKLQHSKKEFQHENAVAELNWNIFIGHDELEKNFREAVATIEFKNCTTLREQVHVLWKLTNNFSGKNNCFAGLFNKPPCSITTHKNAAPTPQHGGHPTYISLSDWEEFA